MLRSFAHEKLKFLVHPHELTGLFERKISRCRVVVSTNFFKIASSFRRQLIIFRASAHGLLRRRSVIMLLPAIRP